VPLSLVILESRSSATAAASGAPLRAAASINSIRAQFDVPRSPQKPLARWAAVTARA